MTNEVNPISSRWAEYITSKQLDTVGEIIRHGFFTRRGGGSKGIYRSLNVGLGSGDDIETVTTNRAAVCVAMGVAESNLVTVSQCHSTNVAVIDQPQQSDRPRADALVTRQKGLLIGILTADCGPVLLVEPVAGIVAAAHAGWHGAMDGILENTIDAMISLGAERQNIVASLGPCISQKNYEVGPEYFTRFVEADSINGRYFVGSSRTDHHRFDLANYIIDRLQGAGVKTDISGDCTYQEVEKFYSYRRSTHNNQTDYGRQISAIMLTE